MRNAKGLSALTKSSDSCYTLELENEMLAGRIVGASLVLLSLTASAHVVRFDRGVPGKLPAGWSVAMTHEGAAPQWEIVRDQSAPSPPYVLAQVSRDRTAGRFPLAIWDAIAIRDGEASVAFKT